MYVYILDIFIHVKHMCTPDICMHIPFAHARVVSLPLFHYCTGEGSSVFGVGGGDTSANAISFTSNSLVEEGGGVGLAQQRELDGLRSQMKTQVCVCAHL